MRIPIRPSVLFVMITCSIAFVASNAAAASPAPMHLDGDVNHLYYSDGTHVLFLKGKGETGNVYGTLKDANPATFQLLRESLSGARSSYASDGTSVYYLGSMITGAQVRNFAVLADGYAEDSRCVYYLGKRIPRMHNTTFKTLGDSYATDGRLVLYAGKLLKRADPKTFTVTGNFCAKDASTVYCSGFPSAGADPATYTYIQDGVSKDRAHVWCYGKIFVQFDPPTFTAIDATFFRDRSGVYMLVRENKNCSFMVIVGADSATFHLFAKNGTPVMHLEADRSHVYRDGVVIQNADPATFNPDSVQPK